jgi:hypothetical protein
MVYIGHLSGLHRAANPAGPGMLPSGCGGLAVIIAGAVG